MLFNARNYIEYYKKGRYQFFFKKNLLTLYNRYKNCFLFTDFYVKIVTSDSFRKYSTF